MRLMIVDDDYQIREGMRLGVEWEKLGIDEVITCANGLEAMEEIRKQMPDIILADVQMPGMTGLEMVSEIRKISKEVRVIFISAYSEFEYCRQALQLGADDYILKPIQFQKLEEIILKNVDVIRKRRKESNQYQNALLTQEVYAIYEKGKNQGDRLCELLMANYPFVKEGWFLTIAVCFDDSKKTVSEKEWEDFSKNIERIVFERNNGIVLPKKDYTMVFLAQGNPSALLALYQQTELRNRLVNWNQLNGEHFGSISAGISCSHDIHSFAKGYQEAKEALQERFFYGTGSVQIHSVSASKDISVMKTESWITCFDKALRSKNFENVQKEVEKWKKDIEKYDRSPDLIKQIGKKIFRDLCKKQEIIEFSSEMERDLDEAEFLTDYIKSFLHCLEIHIWEQKHKKEFHQKYSHMVKLALDYVEEHYQEPLTLAEVAEAVGKSTNYFGAAFKKEIGKSFTEYLTSYRMEQAKYLLLHTNQKVKDICEKVGYTDYVYFSQIFKQIYGCSASQIRQNILTDDK